MTFVAGALTNGLQLALDSILVKPKRLIGSIAMQVTLEEHHEDSIEITDHPVESGAQITDHAFRHPARVTIKGAWSSSPSRSGLIDGLVGGVKATIEYPVVPEFGPVGVPKTKLSGQTATPITEIYAKLLKLQKDVIPFDIYTGKRKYSNMLIQTLSVTTDKQSENSLMVTLLCREVLIVSTALLTVPSDLSRQAKPGLTASPTPLGTKSLLDGTKYSSAGAGRGNINPAFVTP